MQLPAESIDIFDNAKTLDYFKEGAGGTIPIKAVQRPYTQSAARNVERFLPLRSTDEIWHAESAPLEPADFHAAELDGDGNIALSRDQILHDGSWFDVIFVERHVFATEITLVLRKQI